MTNEQKQALIDAAILLSESEAVTMWAESENEHTLQPQLRSLASDLDGPVYDGFES